MVNDVIGVLLAAGQGRRFGGDKLLQTLSGSNITIAEQSANIVLTALPHSIAVVRPRDHALKVILDKVGMPWTDNVNAEIGISSSIQCAINVASESYPEAKGWLFYLADMPLIPASVVEQIAAAVSAGALIAAPEYQGVRGNPVAIGRQLQSELNALQGDSGAKSILQRHQQHVQLINVATPAVLHDIDSQEDLHRLTLS